MEGQARGDAEASWRGGKRQQPASFWEFKFGDHTQRDNPPRGDWWDGGFVTELGAADEKCDQSWVSRVGSTHAEEYEASDGSLEVMGLLANHYNLLPF